MSVEHRKLRMLQVNMTDYVDEEKLRSHPRAREVNCDSLSH